MNKYQEALDVLKRIDFRTSPWQMEDLLEDRFIEVDALQELIDKYSKLEEDNNDLHRWQIQTTSYISKLEKALDKACEALESDMPSELMCNEHCKYRKNGRCPVYEDEDCPQTWKEWLLEGIRNEIK